MNNLNRRLGKIEKQLHIEKPHIVNILGMEVSSDEFKKILEEINGKTKGVLPCQKEISEYQARVTKSN